MASGTLTFYSGASPDIKILPQCLARARAISVWSNIWKLDPYMCDTITAYCS